MENKAIDQRRVSILNIINTEDFIKKLQGPKTEKKADQSQNPNTSSINAIKKDNAKEADPKDKGDQKQSTAKAANEYQEQKINERFKAR